MTAWSEAELEALALVAEAVVPGHGLQRAEMAAEAYDLGLDPQQVKQLRLVLRLMESPLANLALTGRPERFRDLPAEARPGYLLGWATSRLGLRRSAFQALRRILSYLAYADPGGEAGNSRLIAIGYSPDDSGLTPEPTPITLFEIPPRSTRSDADEPTLLEADVVIVGSGAGGGVVAKALAEAGKSVVVLEAGPFIPEPEMPRNELDAFDRLYLAHGLTATWDASISILAGAGLGGGTTINWMTCIAARDTVRREWATGHGLDGFDGPEGDADFAAIGREIGVQEVSLVPPKDVALLRGAADLGLEAAPTQRNGLGCRACGSCPFGCRAGTKQSGLRVHLADAWRAGARIVADARVERVLIESRRVTGIEATIGWESRSSRATSTGVPLERRRLVVHAPQVVVAAGALRSPVVLERSGLEHPALGRHLRLHPVPIAAGRFQQPIEMWRGTMQAARSLAFVEADEAQNGYVVESAPGHPGLISLAFPWEGVDAHEALMSRVRWIAPLVAVTRDGGAGRVRATRTGGARIDYRLDASGMATMRHALATMARILRAAGADEIVAVGTPPTWHRPAGLTPDGEALAFDAFLEQLGRFDFAPNRGSVFSAHQMGSVRAGADPREHPCDPAGRVRVGSRRSRVVAGLYVADSSLFPTGLGVNPMLTVMALARRVARAVLAEA